MIWPDLALRRAGIFNDMGSGSYVDLVVIKPKDDVQYLKTFDEAKVKVFFKLYQLPHLLTKSHYRVNVARSTHTRRERLLCSPRKSEISRWVKLRWGGVRWALRNVTWNIFSTENFLWLTTFSRLGIRTTLTSWIPRWWGQLLWRWRRLPLRRLGDHWGSFHAVLNIGNCYNQTMWNIHTIVFRLLK